MNSISFTLIILLIIVNESICSPSRTKRDEESLRIKDYPPIKTRILGGKKTKQDEWNFMAVIMKRVDNQLIQWCGGTLITDRHILSAAHCYWDSFYERVIDHGEFVIRLGTKDYTQPDVEMQVNKIHFNDYKPDMKQNDIAILELKDKVNLSSNKNIAMVKLPEKNNQYSFKSNNGQLMAKVAGWGITENKTDSKQLLEAGMSMVDWKKCKDMNTRLGEYISEQHICAKRTDNSTQPTDTCQGDSGGPLIQYFEGSKEFVQTGITSFGMGCGDPKYPGVYAKAEHFVDWINEVINENKTKGNIDVWKSMVPIKKRMGNKWVHWCAGSLISDVHVLSAANCFWDQDQNEPFKPSDFKFLVHTKDFELKEHLAQSIHFSGSDNSTPVNIDSNLAVIVSSEKVDWIDNDHVKLMFIPDKEAKYEYEKENGTFIASIAGWAQSGKKLVYDEVIEFNMTLMDRNTCNDKEIFRSNITDKHICAMQADNEASSSITICNGDSGGPLVQFWKEGKYRNSVQTGVNSMGRGYARVNKPTAYTQVQPFSDWIRDVIRNTSDWKLIDEFKPAMLGGEFVLQNEFKFMVAILKRNGDKWGEWCGGTLITDQYVLTAAHCFWDNMDGKLCDTDEFLLRLGTHDINKVNVDAKIKKIHLNDYNATLMQNDIAILELDQKVNVTGNDRISLVKLARKNATYAKNDNGTFIATAAGWGKTENASNSDHLLKAHLAIVDWRKCKNMQDFSSDSITEQNICAIQTDNATRPTDTCQGDSGGPLIQFDDARLEFVQTGITSFGEGCAREGRPGAYARVEYFIDWISNITQIGSVVEEEKVLRIGSKNVTMTKLF